MIRYFIIGRRLLELFELLRRTISIELLVRKTKLIESWNIGFALSRPRVDMLLETTEQETFDGVE